MFVVWCWECNSDESDTISDTSSVASTQSHGDGDGSKCANDGGHETDPKSFESTQVTHTVMFKCIGCTCEHQYQETLALAHQLLKQNTDLPVRLFHEENNHYNSRALAIQCQPDGDDEFGYIVKEALEEEKNECKVWMDNIYHRLETKRSRLFCWHKHYTKG